MQAATRPVPLGAGVSPAARGQAGRRATACYGSRRASPIVATTRAGDANADADAAAAVHAPEGNRRSLMFAAALATGLGLPPPPALAAPFGPLLSERLERKVGPDR